MASISRLEIPKPEKEIDLQKGCWNILQDWQVSDPITHKWKGEYLSDYSYHVPNGAQLAGDARVRAIRMKSLKLQGFKTGVSDLVIAYPIWQTVPHVEQLAWPGAYLELKMPGKYPTPDQRTWLDRMDLAGYFSAVVRSEYEFRSQIIAYMAGKSPVPRQKRKK